MQLTGYRNGDEWYDANGDRNQKIQELIEGAGGIAPWLSRSIEKLSNG